MTEENAFLEAIAIADPTARASFLDRACVENTELRRAVEALLAAHLASNPLDRPAVVDANVTQSHATSSEKPGTIIAGRYKLLEEIGAGGMGTVWVAEQLVPVKRKVALKLIKPGMDSHAVLARFEAERQALALMDHPNIAKVHDGGLTETGRPYFVMEYVKGVPITEYCDTMRLRVEERLQLFIHVCHAVQHAHQKGVIHRDLKPSNILVAPYDGKPVPKVIDFGLAKAMHQPLTEKTLHTAHEALLGTPLYMSPEQAQLNNLDVDTRSDIYSLGVFLYELLTGTTPLDRQRFKEAAWDEICRLIREEEPPRPSVRLSSTATLPTLAAGRQTEPVKLTKLLRGDLDWVVMKALEKERGRRYESANDFAADVERYLTGDPVQAAPPSVAYRLRKFVERYRGPVMVGSVVAFLLIAGIVGTSWGWREALWQRDEAIQARKDLENESAARIAAENEKTKTLDDKAKETIRQSKLLKAHVALEKGMERIERGEYGHGLHWFIRGLADAPADAHELSRSLRLLLAGWGRQLHNLRAQYPVAGEFIAYSRDGRRLISAGTHGILVRDAATGKALLERKQLITRTKPWRVIASSPDLRYLVSLEERPWPNEPGVYEFIDTMDGKSIGTLGAAAHAHFLAFSGDSKTMLVHHGDEEMLKLWDAAELKPLPGRAIKFPFKSIPAWSHSAPHDFKARIILNHDATRLLIHADYYGGKLWDTTTAKPIGDLTSKGTVLAAAFSLDGKLLATVAGAESTEADPLPTSTIQVWNGMTGEKTNWTVTYDHEPIHAITFSPDSQRLAVSSQSAVDMWSFTEKKLDWIGGAVISDTSVHGRRFARQPAWRFELRHRPARYSQWYPSPGIELHFSPDGNNLLRLCLSGMAQVFDGQSAYPIGEPIPYSGGIYFASNAITRPGGRHVAFTPDGRSFALLGGEGAQVWEVRRPEQEAEIVPLEKLFKGYSSNLHFDPTGEHVIAGSSGDKPQLRLWDTRKGKQIDQALPVVHTNLRYYVQNSFNLSDRKILYFDKGIREWDIAAGRPTELFIPSEGGRSQVLATFNPDLILYRDDERDLFWQIWTRAGKRVGPKRNGELLRIWATGMRQDGKVLAALDFDDEKYPTVRFWDTQNWQAVGTPIVLVDRLADLGDRGKEWFVFSPDGRRLAHILSTEVRLYDLRTGKPEGKPLSGCWDIAFSPDGALLITGSVWTATQNAPTDYSGIRILDLATGKTVCNLPGPAFKLAFRGDSTLLSVMHQQLKAWRVPRPIEGTLERLRLWAEVYTKRQLDEAGNLVEFRGEWRENVWYTGWGERYDRLQELGGPPAP